MCKENDESGGTNLDLSLADKSWGALPECRIGYAPVSIEKHPSGFVLTVREVANEMEVGKHVYQCSFDCPGSLEVFIASMTDYLDSWKARE